MALDTIPKQEGGKLKAVASGTLPSGQPVVVNADGTVSVIEGQSQAVGSPVVFEAANSDFIAATFDTNSNKVVFAYRDEGNSNYGTAIVGTVSGTSISFGTPVVFESQSTDEMRTAAFDSSSNKVVLAYRTGNPVYGSAVVGTVSGTSISFGTPVSFSSSNCTSNSITFDSTNNSVVISYRDIDNSLYGTAVVGTVSGTSISFGSPTVFESANIDEITSTFDSSSGKAVIAYRDRGNSDNGTAIVGTVSGTSISFGTAVVFESASSTWFAATFDSNSNRVVIAYRDVGNSGYGTAVVGTVSGTSISFGTPVVFENASSSDISATYDTGTQSVIIAYRDNDNSGYGTAIVGDVNNTSISFSPSVVFESAEIFKSAITFDTVENKAVIAYKDNGNSNYGTSVVLQAGSTTLTSDNYIGTAATGAPDGQGAKINIKGAVDENQSGLTAGQSYYVQTDGTLGTTPADPSVFAGTAVAATKLIVKG